jgi:CBS domain-containing protein
MRVKDLMTQPACTCSIHDTANVAAKLMWEHDCGIVPVIDDEGRLAGVVTDRDVCMAAYFQGRRLTDIPIDAFMTRDLSSCHAEDALPHAQQLMTDRQIHRVPVVDQQGAPIGMLSLSDLAREVVRTGNGRHAGDPGDALLHTVAAITRPRWEAR